MKMQGEQVLLADRLESQVSRPEQGLLPPFFLVVLTTNKRLVQYLLHHLHRKNKSGSFLVQCADAHSYATVGECLLQGWIFGRTVVFQGRVSFCLSVNVFFAFHGLHL